MDVLLDMADDGLWVDAPAGVIVGKGGLDRLLRQHAAMHLCGGQAVQRLHHGTVGKGKRIRDAVAVDHLGGDGAGGDSGAAAEGLEFHIGDGVAVDFQVHLHDIAAAGVAYLAHAVGVGQLPYVAGVGEVIQNFFTIHRVLLY